MESGSFVYWTAAGSCSNPNLYFANHIRVADHSLLARHPVGRCAFACLFCILEGLKDADMLMEIAADIAGVNQFCLDDLLRVQEHRCPE